MKTKTAIEFYGSVEGLASVLGVSASAIRQWGEDVPSNRAYEIADLADGFLIYEGRFTGEEMNRALELREFVLKKAELKARFKAGSEKE